ncbi:DUF5786 family protein [Halovenus rubra]|uniref:DUF5786 family protein n=2 Tax=Halovenus rubra TaxID=869890 RepID=A0ACC7DXY1_9EURY|nr:DUF5786 family protein [Halovenus rubra]
MGFGSYDESEQETQERDEDENAEAVSVHENEHDGEVKFESDMSTEGLVDKLDKIKDTDDEDDD